MPQTSVFTPIYYIVYIGLYKLIITGFNAWNNIIIGTVTLYYNVFKCDLFWGKNSPAKPTIRLNN
jgi:hypothetical protein